MNINKARHKIKIYNTEVIYDYESKEIKKLIRECWAEIQNLHGKEFWEAKSVQQDNVVKFIIRYTKTELTQDMFIEFRNKKYNIISIDNIAYMNKDIIITAKEEQQCQQE